MHQPLSSRLAVAAVGVVELVLGVGHSLVASLEQEIVMRLDRLVEVVEFGAADWMSLVRLRRDLVVGVASVPDR
jgi:hypothetical protein